MLLTAADPWLSGYRAFGNLLTGPDAPFAKRDGDDNVQLSTTMYGRASLSPHLCILRFAIDELYFKSRRPTANFPQRWPLQN